VRRLLAREPHDRFPSAADCARALETAEPPEDETAAALERDTRIARVFLSEAVELQEKRMYADAKARLLDALRVFRDRQAMRDPAVVPVLKLLARNYVAQGRYDRAEEFFRASLSLRREEVGANHPEIATELRYLGQILRHAGKFREAGNAYVEAWNIVRRSAGPKDPTLIRLLEHIATCHLRLGMRPKAREILRKALAMAEESTGVSHAAIARILNSLASLALEEDDLPSAEVCLLRSLELLRARYQNRHGCAAEAMELYSVLLQKRGIAAESAEWFRRGQEIRARRAEWKARSATG
jgi:tetratricopeptide (TPR) repeat protein